MPSWEYLGNFSFCWPEYKCLFIIYISFSCTRKNYSHFASKLLISKDSFFKFLFIRHPSFQHHRTVIQDTFLCIYLIDLILIILHTSVATVSGCVGICCVYREPLPVQKKSNLR